MQETDPPPIQPPPIQADDSVFVSPGKGDSSDLRHRIKRRKKTNVPMIAGGVSSAIFLLGLGMWIGGLFGRADSTGGDATSMFTTDSDLRAYLRDNVGEPEWEEIRWWPAKEMKKEEFTKRHVLFQREERATYIKRLLTTAASNQQVEMEA